ncbi:MAG: TRAP transporter small permease [Clostridia bacterium]|nr:TRAP transporter small permease [Clostridia bacterium]
MKIKKGIHDIASMLDKLAGLSIVLAMLLVVLNVIVRKVFSSPLLGAYEFTGFLTALIVAFGLSACLVSNSHIAVDFLVDKLKKPLQKIIDFIVNSILFIFLSFFTYKMFGYATSLLRSHELSPTTKTPFYLFIYVIAFCFIILSMVSLFKAIDSIKEVKSK